MSVVPGRFCERERGKREVGREIKREEWEKTEREKVGEREREGQ